jgi:hypothetical protein
VALFQAAAYRRLSRAGNSRGFLLCKNPHPATPAILPSAKTRPGGIPPRNCRAAIPGKPHAPLSCSWWRHWGVFEEMQDNRINMPDLYRIDFGLGRKGGFASLYKNPKSL